MDGYAPGNYTVALSVTGSLVKKIVVSLPASAALSVNPVWKFGDLDGDNFVSQAEVSYIAAHVGTVISTSPVADDKLPAIDTPYILASADLNGDRQITQADVDLAQANLGVQGD